MEKQLPTPWVWTVCNLPLRCQIGSNIAIWALKPSIALTHPKSDDIEPHVKLSIDTEKSFQYSDDLGWNWHKSWNIPTISLAFDITDPNTKEKLLCPADFKAHLFAVKPFIGNENKLTLIDIGLQGGNQVDIIDGKAVFQGLKFASTSFNNEGVKFHLIICVYLQITEDSKPKILKAMISPPIFVDSRRGIRENEKSTTKDNPLFVYGEPFFPDKFTKKFIKKDPKKKDVAHEDIQNSIEGLFSYLVAPNIRNKIRHPAFLSVRFSACASFYYNPTKITNKDLESFIEIFQSLIHEDLTSKTVPQEVDLTHSFFLMWLDIDALEDKVKKKKLLELVSPIRYKSLSVVFQKSEIPSYFVQLTDLKGIADLYTKCYPNIMAANKDLFNDEDEQDDENSADKIPPPEKQLVVFNQDTGPTDDAQWRRYLEFTEQLGEPTKKLKDERNSPSVNVFEDSIKDPRQQMLGNLKSTAQNNVINLEQNPMLRNPTGVNMNPAVFFNPLQGQMPQFARPGLDPSQIPAMWLPGQNIPGAFPQHFAAYPNIAVNPAAGFPMMGYSAGVPIAAGANPMMGLNVQQPMLNRDLNKVMANYMMGVQGQDQQELMEIKRESDSVPYYTVKSEGNIKEEDEV